MQIEHTVTQSDIDAGEITCVADISAEDPFGTHVTDISDDLTDLTGDDDPTVITVPQTLDSVLTKTGSLDGTFAENETITFTFELCNTGNVTITNAPFTDADLGIAAGAVNFAVPLAPGACDTQTATYTITAADVAANQVSNTASVDIEDLGGNGPVNIPSTDTPGNPPGTPTVITGNDPPEIIPGQEIPPQDTPVNTPVNLPTATKFTDPDGTIASYSATGLPTGLTIDPATGVISGTPTVPGQYSVIVTAQDNEGGTVDCPFEWDIQQAPQIIPGQEIPPQTNEEGELINVPTGAKFTDEDPLTFSATGLPAGISIDPATGLISGTVAAGEAANSPFNVVVTATDDDGQSVDCPFGWTVSEQSSDLSISKSVNDPTPNVGDTVTFTLVAQSFADAATNVVISDLLPVGLTFVSASAPGYDDTTGVWTRGNYPASNTESLQITATVNAGTEGQTIDNTATIQSDEVDPTPANNTDNATITVNVPPAIVPGGDIPDQGPNPTGTAIPPLDTSGKFSDSDGTIVSYSATGLPPGVTIDSSTGIISGTPTTNGTYNVIVTAEDDQGGNGPMPV